MSDDVTIEDDDAVRIIRLNRPEKKNALTNAMYRLLTDALAGVGTTTRCLLITANGPDFCAGNDIDDFMQVSPVQNAASLPVLAFLHALARNETPIVAAVRGAAIGIGTTMLLHCDQVIAGDDARFATPFAKLGLVPEAGSSLLAPRLMGHGRAFGLLAMGRTMTAHDALASELVSRVVAVADVEREALATAREIAALPADAMRVTRRLMRGDPDALCARIDQETHLFAERLASPDAQAALRAFKARRR